MAGDGSGALQALFPSDNPFFRGGFGLAVLGAGVAALRRTWTLGSVLLRRHLVMTLEVTSKDRSYPWVLDWVTAQSRTQGSKRAFGGGHAVQHLSVNTSVHESSGSGKTVFGLVPGPGIHLLRYRGKWLGVERSRETAMLDFNTGRPWEKITLTAFGRDTTVFSHLLEESLQLASSQEEGKMVVYTNWGAEWRAFGHPRRRRSLDSVVLDSGVAERILTDLAEWKASQQWYIDRGIPYRRGYLLHGTPGSGKTSFVTAVAGWLQYNVCLLNLSEAGLTDDRLALALSTAPQRSVILLEDIDAAFISRDHTDHYSSNVTFSGLLNTLDGVASSEERLVFMTTNHIERLDPALIRPGRVDVVERLGPATAAQRVKLFRKFFPDACKQEPGMPDRFNERIGDQLDPEVSSSLSMAQLQGYLLLYKHDPQAAVANVSQLQREIEVRAVADGKPGSAPKKARPVRPLTALDVDRMFYSPQTDTGKIIGPSAHER